MKKYWAFVLFVMVMFAGTVGMAVASRAERPNFGALGKTSAGECPASRGCPVLIRECPGRGEGVEPGLIARTDGAGNLAG